MLYPEPDSQAQNNFNLLLTLLEPKTLSSWPARTHMWLLIYIWLKPVCAYNPSYTAQVQTRNQVFGRHHPECWCGNLTKAQIMAH